MIGPNGAGKTTVFNVVTGLYHPSEGQVHFNGDRIDGKKRFAVTKLGIARTFQNVRLFHNMSALENVLVGADAHHRTGLAGAGLGLPWHRREERRVGQRPLNCWSSSAFQTALKTRRRTCRTATSGGWRSPGRWPPIPSCCCSTSLPQA